MRTRKTKSIFFLFLFFSIFLGSISSFSINVKAVIPTENLIFKANQLYASVGDFADATPNVWEDDISFEVGGEDLLEFTNLGVVSSSDDSILFKAEIIFGFEINAFTSVGILDAFPNMNKVKYGNFMYLTYLDLFGSGVAAYYAKWYEANIDGMRMHNYQGSSPITVYMKPLTSSGGNITLNGITFELPSYEYDILKVDVVKTSDSEIGHTFNEFGQNTEHQNVDVEFVSIGDTSSLNQDVLDILTASNLGVSVISDIKYSRTLSSGKISTIGGTFHNSNPKEYKEFTFSIGTTIVPEYRLYTDTLRTCTATVFMHRPLFGDPYLSIMSGPESKEYVRPVGVDICTRFSFPIVLYRLEPPVMLSSNPLV